MVGKTPTLAPSDVPPNTARRIVFVFVLVGSAMFAIDWLFRFYWFRWHEKIVGKPIVTAIAPAAPANGSFTEENRPAGRVGDLANLLESPRAKSRYGIPRAASTIPIDPEGFRSPVYRSSQQFEYVVVGDSYMAYAEQANDLISVQLANRLGRPVLNRAYMGKGPFQSLMLWIERNWDRTKLPRWIIWGFVERDISAHAFGGYVYLIERHRGRVEQELKKAQRLPYQIYWKQLRPHSLKKSWPDTSVLAWAARKCWARWEYDLFGRLAPDVILMRDPTGRSPPMLGYRIALESMYWPPSVRGLEQVADAIQYISDYLREKNIQLMVVPIPDKEQVYREWIDPADWKNGQPPPPSIIPNLVALLRARNVPAVDLWTPFRQAALDGKMLYWEDDTHWRPEGISLAADWIASELQMVEARDLADEN